MYIHIHVYIYIYTYTHTYIYIYIHTHRDTYVYIYIYIQRERDVSGGVLGLLLLEVVLEHVLRSNEEKLCYAITMFVIHCVISIMYQCVLGLFVLRSSEEKLLCVDVVVIIVGCVLTIIRDLDCPNLDYHHCYYQFHCCYHYYQQWYHYPVHYHYYDHCYYMQHVRTGDRTRYKTTADLMFESRTIRKWW